MFKRVFYGAALALVGAAGCSDTGPPIRVTAADLYAAYLKNAAAADQQYRGRNLIVTGMSGGIDSDGSGYILTLVPGIRAQLGSDTAGANLFEQVTVRCRGIQLNGAVLDLKGCEISSDDTDTATGLDETVSAPPDSPPPIPADGVPVGSGSTMERLEAAFQAATGHRSAYDAVEDGSRVTTRPLRIVSLPFGKALLTERRIQDGCHACQGTLGVFYLAERGGKMSVTRSWPKAIEGSGFGAPPTSWRVTNEFTDYPAIYAETSYMAQGDEGQMATIIELTPRGPVASDPVSLRYSDAGTIVDNERPACILDGAIANIRKDRSFDVLITGSIDGTDHYVKRGGRFVLAPSTPRRVTCNQGT